MMAQEQKLSLLAAILININIMLGTGIFINTVELSQRTGLLSGFMYPLIGFLILPLLLTITKLIELYPSGSFYAYAQHELSPFMGFLSTWSYFIAKLASASLMVHVSVALITQIFPALLTVFSVLSWDLVVISVFIGLNLLNMQTGSRIQYGFLVFKLIPLLFAIGACILLLSPSAITSLPVIWSGIPGSLPLVLYAVMGFEATCALSSKIENSARNGPRAIIISFIVIITLVFLFQFLLYATLGQTLANQTSYLHTFPALLQKFFGTNAFLNQKLQALFHLAIASSALGGCYGILYSNNWNFFILAQHKAVKGWRTFIKLNSQAIPYFCLLMEWLICMAYLLTATGNQVILQQFAALGTTITYTTSVIALLRKYKNDNVSFIYQLIPLTGLCSCVLLIATSLRNFYMGGILSLVGFCLLLLIGILLYNKNTK